MKITYAFVLSILIVAFCVPRALEAQNKAAAADSVAQLLKNVEQVRADTSCDRTCLKDVMTKYLDSLVAHGRKTLRAHRSPRKGTAAFDAASKRILQW